MLSLGDFAVYKHVVEIFVEVCGKIFEPIPVLVGRLSVGCQNSCVIRAVIGILDFLFRARNEIFCPTHRLVEVVKFFFRCDCLSVDGDCRIVVVVLVGAYKLPRRDKGHKSLIVAEEIAELAVDDAVNDCIYVHGQSAQIHAAEKIVNVHVGASHSGKSVERAERCRRKAIYNFTLLRFASFLAR